MTADLLAQTLNRRARDVEREFRATLRGLGVSAVAFDKMKMIEEIYAIPEDVSPKTGKKKWKRTRDLLKGEKWEPRGLDAIAIVNRVPYAVRRERASGSVPRGKKARGDIHYINPVRESHWRDELVKTFRPLLADLYHDTIQAILARKVP